ncbi:hypothetical protein BT63DRAFT_457622 [Microthyrium microscopicum]|uniref:Uncharacterized protein n=1 Tax=Microthyrium microscopicum TaxID=703497 RepID=A0A6A6U5F3_9PEZI|nr:hypothetical protein BT63DRAFT_457622 [Microthyrium microscopicum]
MSQIPANMTPRQASELARPEGLGAITPLTLAQLLTPKGRLLEQTREQRLQRHRFARRFAQFLGRVGNAYSKKNDHKPYDDFYDAMRAMQVYIRDEEVMWPYSNAQLLQLIRLRQAMVSALSPAPELRAFFDENFRHWGYNEEIRNGTNPH